MLCIGPSRSGPSRLARAQGVQAPTAFVVVPASQAPLGGVQVLIHPRPAGPALASLFEVKLLLLVVACLLSASCTSGNLCNDEHPCSGDWECVGGTCGHRYDLPHCGGPYCTMPCTRGPEDGTLNAGNCPSPFISCAQGSTGEQMYCGGIGLDSSDLLSGCSSDEDCADVALVVWRK